MRRSDGSGKLGHDHAPAECLLWDLVHNGGVGLHEKEQDPIVNARRKVPGG